MEFILYYMSMACSVININTFFIFVDHVSLLMTRWLACLWLVINDENGNTIQLKVYSLQSAFYPGLQSAVNFLCFTPSDLTLN